MDCILLGKQNIFSLAWENKYRFLSAETKSKTFFEKKTTKHFLFCEATTDKILIGLTKTKNTNFALIFLKCATIETGTVMSAKAQP